MRLYNIAEYDTARTAHRRRSEAERSEQGIHAVVRDRVYYIAGKRFELDPPRWRVYSYSESGRCELLPNRTGA